MMPKLYDVVEIPSVLAKPNSRRGNRGGEEAEEADQLHTRIAGLTVGAKVVAGHVDDEVLQCLLVARLLALAQRPRHVA